MTQFFGARSISSASTSCSATPRDVKEDPQSHTQKQIVSRALTSPEARPSWNRAGAPPPSGVQTLLARERSVQRCQSVEYISPVATVVVNTTASAAGAAQVLTASVPASSPRRRLPPNPITSPRSFPARAAVLSPTRANVSLIGAIDARSEKVTEQQYFGGNQAPRRSPFGPVHDGSISKGLQSGPAEAVSRQESAGRLSAATTAASSRGGDINYRGR